MTDVRHTPNSELRVLALVDVAAGVWLLAAPFVLDLPRQYPHQLAFLSSLAVGAAVLLLSALHFLQWQMARGASRINIALGLFLIASPVFFGYSRFEGAGHPATVNAVLTGIVIVAGAALCLAGSTGDSAGTRTEGALPVAQQGPPRPALWAAPMAGEPLRPFTGRADDRYESAGPAHQGAAWTAVGLIIAACVVLGFALVLRAWSVAGLGIALGAVGVVVGRRGRMLEQVSLGQHAGGR
jgi:hypothetical protein